MEYFENHTVCYEFKRNNNLIPILSFKNNIDNYKVYCNGIQNIVNNLNNTMNENPNYTFYMWPASMHLIPLFINGFHYDKLSALLDNSPNKIGKIFYGYNIICKNFKEIIQQANDTTIIFLGGAENYKKELDVSNFKGEIINI